MLGGRVGHYVVISTGQVYLVREGRPSPARESGLRRPADAGAPRTRYDKGQWDYGMGKRALEDALVDACDAPLRLDADPHSHGQRGA